MRRSALYLRNDEVPSSTAVTTWLCDNDLLHRASYNSLIIVQHALISIFFLLAWLVMLSVQDSMFSIRLLIEPNLN